MSTKQRFYKFVGDRGFTQLPQGPIGPEAYEALPADLRHIVLHSGAWKQMSGEEIKQYKAELAEAEKASQEAKAKAPEEVKN